MSESIRAIRARLEEAGEQELAGLLACYEQDERSGVQQLVRTARRRMEKLEAERQRLCEMSAYERQYEAQGVVCGIDEAGRGPLAGPVVAAAVILPADAGILYLNDSKKLSPSKRDELFDRIRERAVSFGVGMAGPERIDEINILNADYEAMREAVAALDPQPAVLLNDAVTIPGLTARQVPIIHGDAKSVSIAAASIIAKVTRDRIMEAYDREYPEYGFARHKGYGTADHIAALKKYGPCSIHRRSFIGHFVDLSGEDGR